MKIYLIIGVVIVLVSIVTGFFVSQFQPQPNSSSDDSNFNEIGIEKNNIG